VTKRQVPALAGLERPLCKYLAWLKQKP
jgi:hypothetical protein